MELIILEQFEVVLVEFDVEFVRFVLVVVVVELAVVLVVFMALVELVELTTTTVMFFLLGSVLFWPVLLELVVFDDEALTMTLLFAFLAANSIHYVSEVPLLT